jgi:hypothetical protein
MKLIYYICGAALVITLGVIGWKWYHGDERLAASRRLAAGILHPSSFVIHQDEWITNAVATNMFCALNVRAFAPYQSEAFKELDGLGAVVVEFGPVKARFSLSLSKSNVVAKLRDGSSAELKAFRPIRMDSDQQTIRSSGSKRREMVDATSRIGPFSTDYGFLTLGFDNDSVFSLEGSGEKTITLGLIVDAAFTNIQTIAVFERTLTE